MFECYTQQKKERLLPLPLAHMLFMCNIKLLALKHKLITDMLWQGHEP